MLEVAGVLKMYCVGTESSKAALSSRIVHKAYCSTYSSVFRAYGPVSPIDTTARDH